LFFGSCDIKVKFGPKENFEMLAIAIVVVGLISRVVLHIPNFTPVIALALFGGAALSRRNAVILPVVVMAVTDLVLGVHSTMPFTWGSMILIALLGVWLRERKTTTHVALASIASAVLFFIITNLGSWLAMSLYPKTWAGLLECYIAAWPFFRNSLFSTLIFSVVLFGGYELLVARVKKTRWAARIL